LPASSASGSAATIAFLARGFQSRARLQLGDPIA